MGRSQRYFLVALGIFLLVSTSLAQQDEQGTQDNDSGEEEGEDSDHHDSDDDDRDQQKNSGEYQGQQERNYNYDEQLSLVEYELFDMTPVMFTLYGEEFVDSVKEILNMQSLNSSVVGVLVSDLEYEESTMVATIILSYFNDTIQSQLGDIETYIASYIYDNQDKLSLQTARVASVHSRKVSSLSSESEVYHRGWVFIAGSSPDPDGGMESRSTGSVATVRYSKVEFTLGHEHSFGYGVNKKRSVAVGRAVPKEIAELDDDYIEWYKFKVFHTRNVESVTNNTKEWKSMTWNERSLQQTAETVWSNRGQRHMGRGAIAGTVLSVVSVALVALVVVGYVMHRRRRRKQIEQTETPSLDKIGKEGTDEVTEQTALV